MSKCQSSNESLHHSSNPIILEMMLTLLPYFTKLNTKACVMRIVSNRGRKAGYMVLLVIYKFKTV